MPLDDLCMDWVLLAYTILQVQFFMIFFSKKFADELENLFKLTQCLAFFLNYKQNMNMLGFTMVLVSTRS